MITGCVGHLGGGKSYTEVALGLEWLASGGFWASNIQLIPEAVDRYMGVGAMGHGRWQANYKFLTLGEGEADDNPATWPHGDLRGAPGQCRVLFTIDEVAEWLDAYLSGGVGRIANYCSWFRHSDKLGCDVHLIIQDASMLHKRARCLVQFWSDCKDLKHVKIAGLGIRFPPPWSLCIHRMVYDRTGKNPVDKVGRFFAKNALVWDCYKTAALYGSSIGVASSVVTRGTVVKPNPWLKTIAILSDAALFAVFAYYLTGGSP